jgi:GT2 family glycosyltransferase
LVEHAVQPKVGVVGTLLLYPDKSIQHAGVALGYTGAAGHPLSGSPTYPVAEPSILSLCYRVSAATFACAMVSREKFLATGGLDESLKVGLNDIDFSIRIENQGYENLICSASRLIHLESMSRKPMMSISGGLTALTEVAKFLKKHRKKLRNDPYFKR